MALLTISLLGGQSTADCNNSTTTGWIAMTFCTGTHGPQRMNCYDLWWLPDFSYSATSRLSRVVSVVQCSLMDCEEIWWTHSGLNQIKSESETLAKMQPRLFFVHVPMSNLRIKAKLQQKGQTHFQWDCHGHFYDSIKIAIFKTLRRLDTTGNVARSNTRVSTHEHQHWEHCFCTQNLLKRRFLNNSR